MLNGAAECKFIRVVEPENFNPIRSLVLMHIYNRSPKEVTRLQILHMQYVYTKNYFRHRNDYRGNLVYTITVISEVNSLNSYLLYLTIFYNDSKWNKTVVVIML